MVCSLKFLGVPLSPKSRPCANYLLACTCEKNDRPKLQDHHRSFHVMKLKVTVNMIESWPKVLELDL